MQSGKESWRTKVKQVAEGHYNEITGKQTELHEKRIAICKQCELMKDTVAGQICDPDNFTISPKDGRYVKGCGCRLSAKTRCVECTCPADKW